MSIFLLIFIVVYVGLFIAGWRLLRLVARRGVDRSAVMARAYAENDYDPYGYERELNWVAEQSGAERVRIHPKRAPELSAVFLRSGEGHRYMLCMHDYGTDCRATGSYAKAFYERGFHLLLPDGRGCGESGGKYLGLGYADHYDELAWIDELRRRDPEAEIWLFGLGTGAASGVFCALRGADVKGVIADSCYAGLRETIMAHLMSRFGGMTKVITNFADTEYFLINGLRNAWHSADLFKQIEKLDRPLLLIHGEEDYFFPVRHFEVLCESVCHQRDPEGRPVPESELHFPPHLHHLRIPGAGHIACAHKDPDAYWAAVDRFITATE